jgi:hypothetical protein
MTFQLLTDRLITLRANLRHFDETNDFGDGIDVLEIRSMLSRRIAEVDGALRLERALALHRAKTAA